MKKIAYITVQVYADVEYDDEQTCVADVIEVIKSRAADLKPETIENSIRINKVRVDERECEVDDVDQSPANPLEPRIKYVSATKTVLINGTPFHFEVSPRGCRACVLYKTTLCDEVDCIAYPKVWGIESDFPSTCAVLVKD